MHKERGMRGKIKLVFGAFFIFGILFPVSQARVINAEEIECNAERDTEEFIIEDGVLVGYRGHDAKVIIPDGVIGISGEAFMWNTDVMEVVIPEGVERIEGFTFFRCTSLETIHLPDSLRYIAENAFGENTNLVRLVLPEGLEEIGMFAFAGCMSLEDVQMPESLHTIGEGAFANCQKLKSIDLSAVRKISEDVFSAAGTDFSDLDHVPEMWGNAFRNSNYWMDYGKNKTENLFWIVDGVLLSGQNCSGKVEIPDNVTSIAAYAFEKNEKITSVTIPNTVTRIGREAFSGCKKLKTVGMKDSVAELGEGAFLGCSGLSEIRLSVRIATLPIYVFEQCTKLTRLTLPEQVISVEEYAFPDVSPKRITIPTGVREIHGVYAGDILYVTDMDLALQSPLLENIAQVCEMKELALKEDKLTLHVGEKYPLRFNSGAKATWKSSRRSVAAVGITGNIYAKKPGTTVITATVYGKEYTCKVEVVEK